MFRKLKRPVFPDPQSEFQQYLSVAYSLPAWLIERWSRRWNREELQAIAVWFLHPQPLCLRVNRMLASRDEILATFASQKIRCFPGTLADSLVGLPSGMSVLNLPGWNEGHFSVQDETAQHAALTLDPQPGESVLDLCAAPGTKTTHLAEMMQNRGTIIATDVSEDRLEKVRDNARRLQLEIIQTVLIDRDGINIPDGPFDAILIDAPCTNTGVLGKRIEARGRITPRDIEELSALQQRLLQQAADRVRPGGRILYSTCSIEPEENENNVHKFLSTRPEFELRSERVFRPGDPSDGGYQALLVRRV
ncbi:MAG TPA: RsmB/NOP family class I SAM-dependent RNA methyltransferase [Planctomycetaceae bacterium]|nr:RsmB/NOP family class I SAM-dependent RNA methyltransferase [Planctomycetaceae bacterium]